MIQRPQRYVAAPKRGRYMSDDDRAPYEPPTLTSYGKIEDVTEGFGDEPTDHESGSRA